MTAQSSAKSDTASADPEEQAKAQDALETTEKTEQALERDAASEESLIVTWDGPDDPENPLNFSLRYKCWITAITSLMTFSVSFGSAIWAAATEATAKEFHVSNELMILGITVYVLGFATGPLVFGPMSEALGRTRPLMVGFLLFIVFQIPVGVATNLETIFLGRFLEGAFGSAPLAIVAGMLVDIFDTIPRGVATMAYMAGIFAGPAMGNIVGEYTVQNPALGWRWTAWFTMIIAALGFVPAVFTVPETHNPTLLRRRAARRRLETKNWALHSKMEEEPIQLKSLAVKYGLKPIRMVIHEPILFIMTLYVSLVYGILYLTFVAYPFSFEVVRRIEPGPASLPFLAIFIGVVLGAAGMAWEMRAIFAPKLAKAKIPIPEQRLPVTIVGSFILPIGLFWFAWTSSASINPWPQIVSGVFIGTGIVLIFFSTIIYLVDVYLFDANSALAVNSLFRSAVSAAFPLFGAIMYERLGVPWATSIVAFACVALIPAPILFYIYGKRIRSWSKYAYYFG